MKIKIVVFLIMVGSLSGGCSSVDVYTFKKDRVDQELKGNEGVVVGKKKDLPRKETNPKRTLFGVDIEMTGSGREKETADEDKAEVSKKSAAPAVPKQAEKAQADISKTEPDPQKVQTVRFDLKDETEAEWIK